MTGVGPRLTERDPAWAQALGQLIVMGGDFAEGKAEHNFATDPDAVRAVLEPRLVEFKSGHWRVQHDGALRRDHTATAIRHATAVDATRSRMELQRRLDG